METKKIKIEVIQFEDDNILLHHDKYTDEYFVLIKESQEVIVYSTDEMIQIYNYK
jgi:hypothetical protein